MSRYKEACVLHRAIGDHRRGTVAKATDRNRPSMGDRLQTLSDDNHNYLAGVL